MNRRDNESLSSMPNISDAHIKPETTTAAHASGNQATKKTQRKGLNIAMLGKSDLLQLLSILEGELEARDIYIASLQAQLHEDSYVKERYFHHNISDPFLALMRDNDAVSGSVTPCQDCHQQHLIGNDVVKIEPLPLLEKVVTKFRKQQEKVKRHIALSDAYYSMVNAELQEEKQKHADAVAADNIVACAQKEKEKLQTLARTESAKTKRIESEYAKLLQLVSKERQRYRVIISLLLEERSRTKSSGSGNNDDNASLQLKINELTLKNAELESSLLVCKESEAKMRKQVEFLFENAKKLKLKIEAKETVLNSSHVASTALITNQQSDSLNATRQRDFREPEYETPMQSPYRSASMQSSVYNVSREASEDAEDVVDGVVTVRRTSSVLERKSLRAVPVKSIGDDRAAPGETDLSDGQLKLSNSAPADPNRRGKLSLILSSPTSGAANFALNSPNEPQASFAISAQARNAHRPTSVPSTLTSSASPFNGGRQKIQRTVKPPCATQTNPPIKEDDAMAKRSATSSDGIKDENHFPSVTKSTKSSALGKHDVSPHKPQPPKPPKTTSVPTGSQNASTNETRTKPPPLPPKKPNLLTKKNSKKLPARSNQNEKDETRRSATGGNTPERSSRLSAPKVSVPPNSKSSNTQQPANKYSLKRPTSLNMNNNNQSSMKRPTMLGTPQLTAQQRLFLRDDMGGHIRSPITNTVPKSPLEPSMFTFK